MEECGTLTGGQGGGGGMVGGVSASVPGDGTWGDDNVYQRNHPDWWLKTFAWPYIVNLV